MTDKTQSLDKILHQLGSRVTLSPVIGGKEEDYTEAKRAIQQLIEEAEKQARLDEVKIGSEQHYIMKRLDRIEWSNNRYTKLKGESK